MFARRFGGAQIMIEYYNEDFMRQPQLGEVIHASYEQIGIEVQT